jgi:hypothetical protein
VHGIPWQLFSSGTLPLIFVLLSRSLFRSLVLSLLRESNTITALCNKGKFNTSTRFVYAQIIMTIMLKVFPVLSAQVLITRSHDHIASFCPFFVFTLLICSSGDCYGCDRYWSYGISGRKFKRIKALSVVPRFTPANTYVFGNAKQADHDWKIKRMKKSNIEHKL